MRHNRDEYALHRAINNGHHPIRPVGNIKSGHHRKLRAISVDIISKWLIVLAIFLIVFGEIIAQGLEKIINLVI